MCAFLLVVFQVGVTCNNAQIVDGVRLGQPTEGALLTCAVKVILYGDLHVNLSLVSCYPLKCSFLTVFYLA